MQIVPPRYLVPPGGYAGTLAPGLRSWFAETVTEPIPEALSAIIRRLDRQPSAERRSLSQNAMASPSAASPI